MATRAEIIGGLKKQGFLTAQGKHIVPNEIGLSLFGVLKQPDPALVDPGVTAQLECLLDRAGWHTTGALRMPVNITLILLPSRAPELNPVENIWQYMRAN